MVIYLAMVKSVIYLCSIVLLLYSCKPSIKPEELYGKWKYTKVEHPDADPPDTMRGAALAYEAPYIQKHCCPIKAKS